MQTVATKSLTQNASREWVFNFTDALLQTENGFAEGGGAILKYRVMEMWVAMPSQLLYIPWKAGPQRHELGALLTLT